MKNKTLRGRVSNQEATSAAVVEAPAKFPEFARVEKDTFKITVKDDNDEVRYTNEEEPYEFPQYDSLADHLRARGAKLTDDQIQFLTEALKGIEPTEKDGKPADVQIVNDLNALEKVSAKNSRYSQVFNAHKPLTEENITNANASIVRNFMKTKNVSDETAIKTLQEFGVIPAEFTLAEYRGNKGKR
jgi:hypothetical protein